jgi:hypothetical protein
MPGDEVRYAGAPPIHIRSPEFTGALEDGVLVLEPRDHYPSLELARILAERFLRGWELDARLKEGRPALAFQYVTGEMVDRDPPPPGSPQVLALKAAGIAVVAGSLSICVTRRTYPDPPADFEFTPDVEVLWSRLEGYHAGREPLLSMAYFCLTWIERSGGGRRSAAKLFGLDKAVLDKLGELATNRGGPQEARKATRSTLSQQLSDREEKWIVACLELLIRRVGEASRPTYKTLTLNHLPKL